MLGSPNYFRGVYDGNGAASDIRTGSVNIQNLLTTYFDFADLPWNLTAFTGRSDYGPFIENGIPAGGLFTGAEVIKPKEYRADYGGLANASFDTCYHADCDDIYNINQEVLTSVSIIIIIILIFFLFKIYLIFKNFRMHKQHTMH